VEETDEFDDPVDLLIAASNNGLTAAIGAIIDAIKSVGDFAGGDVTATLLGVTSKLDFVV
jgi:D-arabinose 5-phosphate isomerase GutQ